MCGEVCRFTHISDAQALLDTLPAQSQIRIWGLNSWQFDTPSPPQGTGGSYLFVPRAELRISGSETHFLVNIDSRRPAEETTEFLRSLVWQTEIPALNSTVISARHQPDEAGWTQLVTDAVTAITGGEMEKVVTARKTALELSAPVSPAAFMQASCDCNHRCFHYMLATGPNTAFVASPPERLYFRAGAQLSTEALAGTVANYPEDDRAAQAAQWLLADKKNVHENSVVVDDICQRLQGAVSALDVSAAAVIRLRKVQHLYRVISATLYAPVTVIVYSVCSRRPPLPVCRAVPRWPFYGITNRLTVTGMRAAAVIAARPAVNLRCRCAVRKSAAAGWICMPEQALLPVRIRRQSGVKLKIKPRV